MQPQNESRRRGRPPKPYGARDLIALPDYWETVAAASGILTALHGRLRYSPAEEQVATRLRVLRQGNAGALITAVRRIIEHGGRPVARMALEGLFTHRLGVAPERLTRVLAAATESSTLLRTEIAVPGSPRPFHVYSIVEPTAAELAALTRLFSEYRQSFEGEGQRIGDVAELYVYRCLRESGRFGMPSKARLGRLWDARRNAKLDLVVELIGSGTVGISVRNQREIAFPAHKHVREMERLPAAFGMPCVLIASYLSRSAKRRLRAYDVGYYELGRQLLPSETADHRHYRLIVDRLRPIIGPRPLEIIPGTGRLPPVKYRTESIIRDFRLIPNLVATFGKSTGNF